MKITHIALCGKVTDGFSYQENLLPKYHKKLGFEVSIIASKLIWNSQGEIIEDNRNVYINENNIKTIRLPYKSNSIFNKKFRRYKGLVHVLEKENPDIIFIHGVQFLDMIEVIKFLENKKNITVYVDNHADLLNSASNWISKKVLHKIIWRYTTKIIEPYVSKFYGVLPARVDFLIDVYKAPKNKVELLLMGADDELIKTSVTDDKVREKYSIKEDDFLVITGGKINSNKKQNILLAQAVYESKKENLKLIIFGSIDSDMKTELEKYIDGDKVQHIGWVESNNSYSIFSSADLVVFPGSHSVFWEQVVGQGIPIMVKYFSGATHIDIGGNCYYLFEDSVKEIQERIEYLLDNPEKYNELKENAKSNRNLKFRYSNIAKKSIELPETTSM